jgi:hypothetical protein
MSDFATTTVRERIVRSIKTALPQGTKTALWLLKLTIPVSFMVFLIDQWGILKGIALVVEPFFKLIGLSGQASIILITSVFTNIYSVIAVMSTMGIDAREGLILANMCLISHALIVETSIQTKTGSNPWRIVLVRLSASFLVAWLLNLLLPAHAGTITDSSENLAKADFQEAFLVWGKAILKTSLKIVILVNLLLILQKLLHEFGLIKWLVKPFQPLLKIMGLPSETSFLWVVAYTLGLSYGGAIMISQAEEGTLSRRHADLLNHHIALSHSQLEDTLLFVAMGFSLPWLMFPRIVLAAVYVWLRRIELKIRSKEQTSF